MSSGGILLVGRQGKILYVNDGYCKQLNTQQEAAIGEPVESIVTNTVIKNHMKDKNFAPEHNLPWAVNPGQYASDEKQAIVSRQVICGEDGESVGAVGQVKFIKQTLELSRAI